MMGIQVITDEMLETAERHKLVAWEAYNTPGARLSKGMVYERLAAKYDRVKALYDLEQAIIDMIDKAI